MCIGALFNPPKPPPPPKRQAPPPQMKAAAPPPEMVTPERIKEDVGEDEKLSTKKKKALEIKATKEGVKEFGAIDPSALPDTPAGGVNTGTGV